jgi:hypothetical protein
MFSIFFLCRKTVAPCGKGANYNATFTPFVASCCKVLHHATKWEKSQHDFGTKNCMVIAPQKRPNSGRKINVIIRRDARHHADSLTQARDANGYENHATKIPKKL